MGSTVFRNPRALSSALAALGTLQPRALGFLNTVDPLDTVSNCYIVVQVCACMDSGTCLCMYGLLCWLMGECGST